MITDLVTVAPTASQEEVAGIVQRYDIIALPVVDDQRHLLGIITVDDVMDVIWELHENQMMRMAGMNEEHNPHERNVFKAFQQRLTWLVITLFGGWHGGLIGFFEQSLSACPGILYPSDAGYGWECWYSIPPLPSGIWHWTSPLFSQQSVCCGVN